MDIYGAFEKMKDICIYKANRASEFSTKVTVNKKTLNKAKSIQKNLHQLSDDIFNYYSTVSQKGKKRLIVDDSDDEPIQPSTSKLRGRGRPPGSKNKNSRKAR
jgi:hypothetical protein